MSAKSSSLTIPLATWAAKDCSSAGSREYCSWSVPISDECIAAVTLSSMRSEVFSVETASDS